MNAIDEYLENINAEQRQELQRIRLIALAMLPNAEEVISYSMPTIKYRGTAVLGFAARKNYIGIYPYSGSILSKIKELDIYDITKSAIREKINNPLPKSLIERIIKERLKLLK